MAYEKTILIKIDKATYARMKKTKMNWSKEVRTFLLQRLNKEANVARAELLRMKLFRKVNGVSSAAVIRKMRDERNASSSS